MIWINNSPSANSEILPCPVYSYKTKSVMVIIVLLNATVIIN